MDVTHRYDLRTARSDWRTKYPDEYTAPVILSNLSIPKAIRLYVEAVASIMKEMGQLQEKGVWKPTKYDDIQDKTKIIRSLLFLKRKRDGTLKARLVADGRKQDMSTCQDNFSPTVATETLFLMAAILAAENRHVATVDIEGAFLHDIMANEVHMLIHEQYVDVLCHGYADVYDGRKYNERIYVKLDRSLMGRSRLQRYGMTHSLLTC